MKVEYVVERLQNSRGGQSACVFRANSRITHCCKQMAAFWEEERVELVPYSDYVDDGKIGDVLLGFEEDNYFGGWYSACIIRFCPFCGEAIETVETTKE